MVAEEELSPAQQRWWIHLQRAQTEGVLQYPTQPMIPLMAELERRVR